MLDLIIRGGQVVLPGNVLTIDVGIHEGRIVKLERDLGEAKQIIEAQSMTVFPGMVDAHVHFGEPGRSHWEGYTTGTRAAAKGGVTTCIEMPQNQIPASLDASTLHTKFQAGEGKLWVDIASLGALSDQSSEAGMLELAEEGVVGFKCFMSPCGDPAEPLDQHQVSDHQLLRGMRAIAALDKVLMVHAENGSICDGLTRDLRSEGKTGLSDFLSAHPIYCEVEAVRRAIYLAGVAGCRLHICHISSIEAVEEVASARRHGQDVSCEVCPHFLIFDSSDLLRLGTVLKCSPPLRGAEQREALWGAVQSGAIDFIASDHSPCPPEMKAKDGLDAWGGTAAVQTSLEMIYSEAVCRRGLPVHLLAHLMARNPAQRFGLTQKGAIALGADADLVLLKHEPYSLTESMLEYRHRLSPYLGMTSLVKVQATILRGALIYSDETGFGAKPEGRYI